MTLQLNYFSGLIFHWYLSVEKGRDSENAFIKCYVDDGLRVAMYDLAGEVGLLFTYTHHGGVWNDHGSREPAPDSRREPH